MAGVEFDGYRLERGLLWPDADKECVRVAFGLTVDLEQALKHCRATRVAIQAGGNCGVWPSALADKFAAVYTFEPEPSNFTSLVVNTRAKPNIICMQAALGYERAPVAIANRAGNCGASYVMGRGLIPVVRIDDLCLPACDLIALDIEGSEMNALKGAVETIKQHRPVIMVEDNGLSERYGSKTGAIEKWLGAEFGYQVAARPHRDIVLIPNER